MTPSETLDAAARRAGPARLTHAETNGDHA